MSRIIAIALGLAAASTASADESLLTWGIDHIDLGYVTPVVHITVANVSASPDAAARELQVVSGPPLVTVEGKAVCEKLSGWPSHLDAVQVQFGHVTVDYFGFWGIAWDASEVLGFPSQVGAAEVAFDHDLQVPETWEGNAVTLGFNPVMILEEELAEYVELGGTAEDFLRQDDVFEAPITVNLMATCTIQSSLGDWQYYGLTRRDITAAIFYQGDPGIQDPPRFGSPGDLAGPGTGSSDPSGTLTGPSTGSTSPSVGAATTLTTTTTRAR